MFKHPGLPTDGSALVRTARSPAPSPSQGRPARITFFYSQPDFPMPIYGEGALIDPTTPEQFAKSAASEAEAILSKARSAAEAAGVAATATPAVNEVPYEAIIDAADRHGCDSSSWPRTAVAASPACCSADANDPQQDAGSGLSLKPASQPAQGGSVHAARSARVVSSVVRIAHRRAAGVACSSSAMWRRAKR